RYLTDTVENKRVPVMFKPGRTGDYTLTCNFDYDNFETVMLEDRQTNLQQNMKLNGSYTFKASKSDDPDRFVIHFGPDKNPSTNVLPARIYSDGTNVVIDLAMISQETEVTVCDVLGRKILQQKLQGEMLHKLYVNTDADVLIVYLYNPYGNLCRKMFRVSNW
ncbi:MAG: hypothetical protein NTV01_22245, partial [Bacteroidia bacterium]|nr:hypothetical protein [Bacteroidia bacterium]